MQVSIVCPKCKILVEVKDRRVSQHPAEGERCPRSGMIYVPVRSSSPGIGKPSVEFDKFEPIGTVHCEEHGGHVIYHATGKVTGDPGSN